MIRKLTRENHDQLFEFLKDQQSINLFFIGDIEAFGYDEDFQEIFANSTIIMKLLQSCCAFTMVTFRMQKGISMSKLSLKSSRTMLCSRVVRQGVSC